ncbi:hypothetical protein BBJ28_00006564 [Nothophytophthora sp. Chile5]|nr:hypothetical protein BBJ28_00006564 [Nothophytophthora sp. Chile5]
MLSRGVSARQTVALQVQQARRFAQQPALRSNAKAVKPSAAVALASSQSRFVDVSVALELAETRRAWEHAAGAGQALNYWRSAALAAGACGALGFFDEYEPAACAGSSSDKGEDVVEQAKKKLQELSTSAVAQLAALLPEDYSNLQKKVDDFLASGQGGQISWGFCMGACSGFALKKVSKLGAVAVGSLFILLQCASYSGYIDVDYKKMERDVKNYLDINKHSQSDVALGTTNGSWADIKMAEGLKKRSNTAQNLMFYVEEQKRLYQELPFSVLPGMRRQSFQRERSYSNLRSRSSWGSFTNLVARGEDQPLLGAEDEFPEPGYTFPLLLSCGVALMSAFQFGYNTGATGGINPAVIFPGHTDLQWAICVSIFAVGGPIGSLTAGQVSSVLGRKKALLVDSFLFIIAGAIMAFAVNIYALILGRFLVGFASGTVSVVVPLYLGELAPPNLRGALGTGYQLFMVMGILAADLMAFGFSGESDGMAQPGWRFLFGFTAIPGILQLALASLLTESPRWLLTKNKPKEAAEILRRLRGSNDVYEEIDSICSASDNESGANTGIWAVLQDRSIRFPLVVAVVLQLAQQFSGINAVMFYASSFFQNVGLEDPLVGATLVYTVNVISTGVALVLMDTAGRRPLLIYSAAGMVVSSVVLTLGLMNLLPFASMASVGGVMCFVWFFEIGLGPIPWLIVAEMFPAKPRPTAMSIATMVNWSCSFLVGLLFPTMQSLLGKYTFVPFGLALCLALSFILKYVPETKGKTISEIQAELQLQQQK